MLNKPRSFFTNHTKHTLLCQYALPHIHTQTHNIYLTLFSSSPQEFINCKQPPKDQPIYIFSIKNHQQQQEDQDPMDSKNPNLDTTHNNHSNVLSSPSSSSQDFKKTNLQHNGLNKFHEDNQGLIFKNAYNEVIKKPTSVSSSSLAAGEAHIKPSSPPPPPSSPPPPSRQDVKKTHQEDKFLVSKKVDGKKGLNFGNPNCEMIKKPNYDHVLSCYSPGEGNMATPPPVPPPEVAGLVEGESGRERLNRHRVEMAGRVRIPDIWGHEDLLKDWIDCSVFDASLGNKTIMSARAALVQEGRSTRRIENQYC